MIDFYDLDEKSTEDGAIAYDYLKSMIRKYNCSFLILHHLFASLVFREQAKIRIVISSDAKNRVKKLEIEKSNYYS